MIPWTVLHQALLSMGFSRQEYWSGLSFPSLGYLPNPGTEFMSSALQVDSLPLIHLESSWVTIGSSKTTSPCETRSIIRDFTLCGEIDSTEIIHLGTKQISKQITMTNPGIGMHGVREYPEWLHYLKYPSSNNIHKTCKETGMLWPIGRKDSK